MIVAGFITWIVFRHKKKIKPNERHTPEFLFRRELIADILLVSGVSIFSFIFWEKGILPMLASRPASAVSDIWFLFIILGITFVLFYLPLRYLFLVEDHSNRQTWKRMLLIFSLLLIRSLLLWLE
jgi:hypothetical protein